MVVISNNSAQCTPPNFKGVYRINKKSENLVHINSGSILDIGCICLDKPLYVHCGDKRDGQMKALLDNLGVKFSFRKFNAPTFCPSELGEYFKRKNVKPKEAAAGLGSVNPIFALFSPSLRAELVKESKA